MLLYKYRKQRRVRGASINARSMASSRIAQAAKNSSKSSGMTGAWQAASAAASSTAWHLKIASRQRGDAPGICYRGGRRSSGSVSIYPSAAAASWRRRPQQSSMACGVVAYRGGKRMASNSTLAAYQHRSIINAAAVTKAANIKQHQKQRSGNALDAYEQQR